MAIYSWGSWFRTPGKAVVFVFDVRAGSLQGRRSGREDNLEPIRVDSNPCHSLGLRLDEGNSFHPGMKHTTGSSGEQGESGEHGSVAGPAAVLD